MDSVTSISPALQPAQTAASVESDENQSAAETLTADFDTFLRLLTTQMQNQDPQNPQDSTEFVAQLASFSAVEQQISTNDKLDSLIASLSQGATQDMASWVGAEVQSVAAAPYTGEPIQAHFEVPEGATIAQLIVSTADGTEIRRMNVDPSATSETWDGKGSDGLEAPEGDYRFAVEGFDDTGLLGRAAAETFSPVVEVRNGSNGWSLVFADQTQLAVDSVTAVR